jgi:hypothetical protein
MVYKYFVIFEVVLKNGSRGKANNFVNSDQPITTMEQVMELQEGLVKQDETLQSAFLLNFVEVEKKE